MEAHLARTAHWLLQTDALDGAAAPVDDLDPWTVGADTAYGRVVQSRPAFTLDDSPREFAWVGRRYGADEAEWDRTAARASGMVRGSNPNGSSSRCAAIRASSVSTSRVVPSATTTPSDRTTDRGHSS